MAMPLTVLLSDIAGLGLYSSVIDIAAGILALLGSCGGSSGAHPAVAMHVTADDVILPDVKPRCCRKETTSCIADVFANGGRANRAAEQQTLVCEPVHPRQVVRALCLLPLQCLL